MSIGDFFSLIFTYWWVWAVVLPLAVLYLYLQNKKTFAGLSLREMALTIEFVGYLLLIYLGQRYLFGDHWYFVIAIPLFIVVFVVFISLLLAGRNIYVLETSFQAQKFHDIDIMKEIIVPATTHRLLIMDEGVYKEKRHVGDVHHQFWRGSDRIKFTDHYDDSTGTFFHPKDNRMHNIGFYAFKAFWLKMRDEIPKLIDQNVLLTWLFNWRLSFKMDVMKENVKHHIKSIEAQHEYEPFEMPEDVEDIFNRKAKEKHKDVERHESPLNVLPAKTDKSESEGES